MKVIKFTDKTTIKRAKHGKDNPYFMMHGETAQDKNLSYEARGMMAYFLSKPDDWEVRVSDLILEADEGKQTKAGKSKVYGILTELAEQRYLKKPAKYQGKGGKWEWTDYEVFERPYPDLPDTEQPETDEPDTERPDTDNPEILDSTESHSTDGQINDLPINEKLKSSSIVPPSQESPPPAAADDDDAISNPVQEQSNGAGQVPSAVKEKDVAKHDPPAPPPERMDRHAGEPLHLKVVAHLRTKTANNKVHGDDLKTIIEDTETYGAKQCIDMIDHCYETLSGLGKLLHRWGYVHSALVNQWGEPGDATFEPAKMPGAKQETHDEWVARVKADPFAKYYANNILDDPDEPMLKETG